MLNHAVKIGDAAKETGLSIDTIRFYEKEGLVQRSGRTEGGFRLFGPGQIQDLKFVRNSQELGFSLADIRELFVVRGDEVHSCSHVKDLLESKLARVEQKIAELQTLKRTLTAAHRKCLRELQSADHSHESRCPVLEELTLSGTSRKLK